MDNYANNIIIGVVSGVGAAWVLSIITLAFRVLFLPWVQDRIYGGIDTGGEWSGKRVDGDVEYNFDIVIKQNGTILSGTFSTVDKFPDNITTRLFNITGIIHGSYIILTYQPQVRSVIGGGTFVLQLMDGGDSLFGAMSYIRTKSGTIQAKDDILLKRKK